MTGSRRCYYSYNFGLKLQGASGIDICKYFFFVIIKLSTWN